MALVVASIVRNEEHRYLKEWLDNIAHFADMHLILDDTSDDNTINIIESHPSPGIQLFQSDEQLFLKDEALLRAKLWELIRKKARSGDWILIVDADEFYSNDLLERKEELLNLPLDYQNVLFRLCDMWNANEFRVDGHWSPYFNRLFRYKNLPFAESTERRGLHCSPLPEYARNWFNCYPTEIRCRHRSYESDFEKKKKYHFYLENVKDEFNLSHARSILETSPRLVPYEKKQTAKLLISSLIRERAWVLPHFFEAIENSNQTGLEIQYQFIINNSQDRSEELCEQFLQNHEGVIEYYNFKDTDNHQSHIWDKNKIYHMAQMRNRQLAYARKLGVDYLINIDSDILIHPQILQHVSYADKDILSPVFWADWSKGEAQYSPQVWQKGGYELTQGFINSLAHQRALLKVGGLGALTAISKRAFMHEHLNYSKVDNLPDEMFGEDRDFCVRARVLGLELWASTLYDSIHVDSPSFLSKLVN